MSHQNPTGKSPAGENPAGNHPEGKRPIFFPFAREIQKGTGILQILLDIASLPLVVFLHLRLGARQCGTLKILCIFLIMIAFFWVGSNGVRFWKYWLIAPQGYQISFIWYMAIFMAMARYHKIVALWRRWRKNPIHSYDKGDFCCIWNLLPVNGTVVYLIVEPLFCFSIAVLFFSQWSLLQTWILMCSAALFLSNVVEWLVLRWWHFDITDGIIESDAANHNNHFRTPNL